MKNDVIHWKKININIGTQCYGTFYIGIRNLIAILTKNHSQNYSLIPAFFFLFKYGLKNYDKIFTIIWAKNEYQYRKINTGH
jgi:hypothetical protein